MKGEREGLRKTRRFLPTREISARGIAGTPWNPNVAPGSERYTLPMLSLEHEVLAAPIPGDAKGRIAAMERREIVGVRPELRALLWIGVALVSGGVGTLLAKNIERIGHVTLIVAIGIAAAGCYAFAWRLRGQGNGPAQPVPTPAGAAAAQPENGRAPRGPTAETAVPAESHHIAAEYLLLLGALLLSADVAYAEAQLHLFGTAWRWHLLILAVVHGATAYLFASRKVLSLAIVALAGLFGVDRSGEVFSRGAGDAAARLAMAAAAVAVWRVVHERVSRLDAFRFPLEQAAFHLAMIASITAIFDRGLLLWAGVVAALALAALGAVHGTRQREESFVVFAILYAVFAIDAAVVPELPTPRLAAGWVTITTPIAIAALYVVHRRWKERFA